MPYLLPEGQKVLLWINDYPQEFTTTLPALYEDWEVYQSSADGYTIKLPPNNKMAEKITIREANGLRFISKKDWVGTLAAVNAVRQYAISTKNR